MTASFADTDIWHVLIASDDMKRMNVEQLDDAFRLSLVDASTMVWKAGMRTWQRLGSVAGLDEVEESITRQAPPPPPPPRPAPRVVSRAPVAFQTTQLLAPVYSPQLVAPDPYVLPKRRVAIPSEVDFRRASGGVRFGRWAVALLLITGGVLGAYRQNLLREGARRLGVEGRYLAGEHRVTAYVSAQAPAVVKQALTRLALLPGPNAAPAVAVAVAKALPPAAVTPTAALPQALLTEPTKPSPAPATDPEPEVKTVSLDSLPVLANDPVPSKPLAAALSRPSAPLARAKPVVTRAPKAEAAQPVVAAKPEPKAKAAPPPVNESPLKAAIRMAIAADAAKKK